MRRLSRLTNQGFGLVEAVVAAGIIAMAAGAMGIVLFQMMKSRAKTQVVRSALAAESAITTALGNPASYGPAIQSAFTAGNTAAVNSNFKIPLTDLNSAVNLAPGQPACFDTQNNLAVPIGTPCDFTKKNHQIQVEYALTVVPSPNSTKNWQFAYRVLANPQNATMISLGAKHNGPLVGTDFTNVIPVEVYRPTIKIECSKDLIDGFPKYIGMQGYDRDSATPLCIQRPMNTCPPGTLPQGLVFDATSEPGNPHLKYNCIPVKPAQKCPEGYSISELYPAAMVLGGRQMTCVRTVQAEVLAPVTASSDGSSIYGAFCPPKYRIKDTTGCTPTGVTSSIGNNCKKKIYRRVCDTSTYRYDPATRTNVHDCRMVVERTEDDPVSHAGYGLVTLTPGKPREAMCSLVTPAQECGSTWAATGLTYTPTCVIDESQFPATVEPVEAR